MNERIQKLAEQAREYATTRHPVSNITLSVNSDLFEQKFAELIVRECVEQIIIRERADGEWYQDDIFKHFGVEE
jgi:hypothetical protein